MQWREVTRSTFKGIKPSFKGISSSHQGVSSFSYGMHEPPRSEPSTSRFLLEASRINPKWVFKNRLAPFLLSQGSAPTRLEAERVGPQVTWPRGAGPHVMVRESAEPEFYRFFKDFLSFLKLDMKSWGLRLAKEDSMSGDRLTLTAESHGDNVLCNSLPPKVRSL